jgi:pyruvate kinase
MKISRHRHAKIVATLGPASSSEVMIRTLFLAGADVFRLNFSHGTHEQHRERLELIRKVEREVGRPIGVVVRKYSIRLMRARANRVMQAARGQFAKPSQTEWRCATFARLC